MQEILDKYTRYLKADRVASPYTVRNYISELVGNYKRGSAKGFFQFLETKGITTVDDLKRIDRNVIREYMAWLMSKGIVKASIARKLSAIRSFYRFLLLEEIVETSPMPVSRKRGERSSAFSLKLDKHLPEFLTPEEIERLLNAPDLSKPQGQRDRALMELLYASGLRVSELVQLNLDQVNLYTREIRVRGKGSKERIVLMGEPAARALTNYIKQGRQELSGHNVNNAVFISKGGKRLIARRAQKILDKYTRAAGINKKVHPHTLRHTFATHMLNGGADLRVVQELLGHADLSSTQIYTHVTKSQAKKVYLATHPLAKGNEDEIK
jgi:site-specific recombinase XerD